MKIAVLIPEFPGQTHAFFWREISHIEQVYGPIEIISTTTKNLFSGHEFFNAASARTHYISKYLWKNPIKVLRLGVEALLYLLPVSKEMRRHGAQEPFVKLIKLVLAALVVREIARSRQVDHIHGHSCADVGYLLAIARLIGGPGYSLTLHGDLAVYGTGHRFKFAGAKFVSCVTHALVKQVAEQIGLQSDRLKMVRMGISRLAEREDVVDSRLGSTRFTLVTVSRLNLQKGHRFVIEAVARLAQQGIEVGYDIVGEGENLEPLRAQVRELGLEDRVNFVGALANERITAELPRYHAFILPSVGLGEAAPVAVMEAMGQGIPVICSIIGGTPEMIEHGVDGVLVPQGDIDAIAAAVKLLVLSPAKRLAMARAGRDRANRDFRFDRNAEALLEAIIG